MADSARLQLITCEATHAIIVVHRRVNYTAGYKRQYDSRGLRGAWFLPVPVKVKSLVCLNQCARKRLGYLCSVITETSSVAAESCLPLHRPPVPLPLDPFPGHEVFLASVDSGRASLLSIFRLSWSPPRSSIFLWHKQLSFC